MMTPPTLLTCWVWVMVSWQTGAADRADRQADVLRYSMVEELPPATLVANLSRNVKDLRYDGGDVVDVGLLKFDIFPGPFRYVY